MTPEAENHLLSRARAGDGQAFDDLVVATAPAVWSLVRRLTADDATAEDALQETFVAAWHGVDGFRGDGTARAWLYGLARRQAARTWRRRAGEPLTTEPLAELALQAGWGADPESIVARAEDRRALLAGIARLSAADQQVLSRCDLEGATPTEVAAELELTAGALRVRLHRARLRLMAALDPEVCNG